MKKLSKIIFATDFSEVSDRAREYLQVMVKSEDCLIQVVHVFDDTLDIPPLYEFEDLEVWMKEYRERTTEKVQSLLRKECDKIGGKCEHYLLLGDPRTQLAEFIHRQKANMVIMGSHGYKGSSRLVLGSVAEYVAQHSKTPVLIVKPE